MHNCLLDMLPAGTVDDSTNQGLHYAVLAGKSRLADRAGFPSVADGANVVVGQSRVGACRAVARASLVNHVLRVGGTITDEQMRGVDTGAIVASVKYPEVFGNRTDEQLIRNAMSIDRLTVTSARSDRAIAGRCAITLPFPTIVGIANFNLCKETVTQGWGRLLAHLTGLSLGATLRAVTAAPGLSHASNYTPIGGY